MMPASKRHETERGEGDKQKCLPETSLHTLERYLDKCAKLVVAEIQNSLDNQDIIGIFTLMQNILFKSVKPFKKRLQARPFISFLFFKKKSF